MDFSLNNSFFKDCKGTPYLGEGFSTEYLGTLPNPITPKYLTMANTSTSPRVSTPHTVSPIELDLGLDSNPSLQADPQIQVLNNDSPAVLGSLADNFSADLPAISDIDHFKESPQLTRRITRAAHDIIKPNPKYALTIAASDVMVPRSPKYALSIPEWRLAMEKEIVPLHDNGTWTLVPQRSDDNVITTKWIFKVKPKEDGSIDRFKARLVANGMRQVQGVDYLNTFSPVVQPLSIHLVLALAVTNAWSIHQIDVSNAFLHDKLEERIVVSQSP